MSNLSAMVDDTATDQQIRPHAGFKPEAIERRDVAWVSETDNPTPLLAKPYAWTEGSYMPCVPDNNDFSDPDEWSRRWDPRMWSQRARRDGIAASLCHGCDVRKECLAAAMAEEGTLSAEHRHLIRGGMTPQGRARLANGSL